MNLTSLNIAIVDDNIETRKLMAQHLKQVFKSSSVSVFISSFDSASSYLAALVDHTFNITFLDIEMPNMDGIQLAKQLNAREINTTVIYVSNREDRVFESLETHPFGFVRKSHFKADIEKVIHHYLESLKKETTSFFIIQNGKEQITTKIDDIIYVETVKRKLCFHIRNMDDMIMTALALQSIEEDFQKKGFLSCYKGILVNYRYIKVINDNTIILKDGTNLPLSRRKVNEVKSKYLELMQDVLVDIY